MDADVVVVGAGIVGLATARALTATLPGAAVVVLEKEQAVARHQTGRNSGVLHSGCYYPPGSAKARLVARGRAAMLDLCAERSIPVVHSGKVVVATRSQELDALAAIERRARAGGIEVHRLGGADLIAVEPHARGIAALHVPSAAALDFGQVATVLAEELTATGGEVRTSAEVLDVVTTGDGVRVTTTAGEVTAGWLVNCAGLHSDRVALRCGIEPGLRIVPFRGEYLGVRPSAADLCRTMIYPVPDPRWPFLGVHLTRGVDGAVHAGPNAVLALGREAYDGGVDRGDVRDLLTDPGLRRLAGRYWATGAAELARARSRRLTTRALQRLVPDLRATDLVPSGSGIRAQALRPDGTLVDDFEFAESPRAVHVLNAPSPAATAALAIGEEVARRLLAQIEAD